MKYTFLLPAYKGKYLAEMLRSIAGQTYTDFKVIISDDCSPEDLMSICKPFLADPRFTYRRNEKNMGATSLVSHWNLLLSLCKTDFCVMASDDDVYEPTFLEEIDILTNKYQDVDLFRGRAKLIDETGNATYETTSVPEYRMEMEFIRDLFSDSYVSCIANYVYRTCTLKRSGGFIDFPKAWFADDATNVKMSVKGCCSTVDIVFNFRMSGLNISSQWGDPKDCSEKIKATYAFYAWMRQWMHHSVGSDPEFLKLVEKKYKEKCNSNVVNNIFSCSFIPFIKFLWKCPKDIGYFRPRMIAHWMISHCI